MTSSLEGEGGISQKMTNDDMMTKSSLPKERIVTFRVAGLAVPGASTMAKNPTYAVLSRNQLGKGSKKKIQKKN